MVCLGDFSTAVACMTIYISQFYIMSHSLLMHTGLADLDAFQASSVSETQLTCPAVPRLILIQARFCPSWNSDSASLVFLFPCAFILLSLTGFKTVLYFTYLVFFGKRLLLIFPSDLCVLIIFFSQFSVFLFPIVIACLCFTKQFSLQLG